MASKSKRARLAPQRDLKKTFMYWSVIVFLIKVIISFNIPAFNIEVNGKPFLLDGIWLGADGENYLKGFDALVRDGLYSSEAILNYWPAGYPLIILFLSFLGKSWVLTSLAVSQSLLFSFSVYYFAAQLYRTRLKNYSYLAILFILLNPTLSLSSLVIGYESLTASGFLIAIALITKDLLDKNDKNFIKYLVVNSLIFGLLTFMQPRLVVSGLLITLLWVFVRKGRGIGSLILVASVVITLLVPATLIYRNNQAVGLKSVSTNLGITMNIGAGDNATGGYMKEGYGVPCTTTGTVVEQDNQRVKCVVNWYFSNPTKSLRLFYNKTLFFWSPWVNNGFLGEVETGTMARNPWLKISPITNITSTQDGMNLVHGNFGKLISWLWLLSGLALLIYGYITLWRQKSIERFIASMAMIAITTNWLISLVSIGDHRFRIPIMGLSLFLQAVGLKTLLRGGKPAMVDGPALR
jgi:hypothetical protein